VVLGYENYNNCASTSANSTA